MEINQQATVFMQWSTAIGLAVKVTVAVTETAALPPVDD